MKRSSASSCVSASPRPPSEPPKPQPDSKFNSAQMDSIRKTLLTDSGKVKKSLADRELEDDIKVLSYKMGRPKCDEHIRIVRKVGVAANKTGADLELGSKKRHASSSPDKSKKKVVKLLEKERIVRKVYAVEQNVDGVSNIEKVIHEKSVKQTSTSQEIHSKREVSPSTDRKTSLDLIKEELERVKSRVDNMNKDRVKSKQGASNSDIKQGGEEESDDEM